MLDQVPVALLLIQLPAVVSEKAADDDPNTWVLNNYVGSLVGIPDLRLVRVSRA